MQPLVSADWLHGNLGRVILLDASVQRIDRGTGVTDFAPGPEAFAQAHIPTARFADLMGEFSDPEAPFNFTAPPRERLRAATRALGITSDSEVVIYDSLGGAYAARLRYMLRGAGLAKVAVLDGGFAAWQAAGHPVESGLAAAAPSGDFEPQDIRRLFTPEAEVASLAAKPEAKRPLICALRAVQFEAGHIPNSFNIPYPSILNEQGLLDPLLLQKSLAALGFDDDIAPVLYCGGGINAAGLALGFELLGLSAATIYDDSMAGWRASGRALETGRADG